jgi:uncharacterized protein YjbJ (UPF0337 family)
MVIQLRQEKAMNKDPVKGAAKQTAGKVQAAVGRAVGSSSQELKGEVKQVEGGAQKSFGNAKQNVKDSLKKH